VVFFFYKNRLTEILIKRYHKKPDESKEVSYLKVQSISFFFSSTRFIEEKEKQTIYRHVSFFFCLLLNFVQSLISHPMNITKYKRKACRKKAVYLTSLKYVHIMHTYILAATIAWECSARPIVICALLTTNSTLREVL